MADLRALASFSSGSIRWTVKDSWLLISLEIKRWVLEKGWAVARVVGKNKGAQTRREKKR